MDTIVRAANFIIRFTLGAGFLFYACKGAWRLLTQGGSAWGWLVVVACIGLSLLCMYVYRPNKQ